MIKSAEEIKIMNIIINILKNELDKDNYEYVDLMSALGFIMHEKECLVNTILITKGDVE